MESLHYYIVGAANGIVYLLDRIFGPVYRHCLPFLALVGRYLALAIRVVYVFLYYLTQHISYTGTDRLREWTIYRDLANVHWDREYAWTIVCSPSLGVRDYRRWRKRKGLRFARPKVRVVDAEWRDDQEEMWRMQEKNWEIVRLRGGPLLGQVNPMDYVSDDDDDDDDDDDEGEEKKRGEDKGKGKEKEVDVGETEHREERLETGYAPGVQVVEQQQGQQPGKGASVGRKEPKRGVKKRKGKR